MNITQRRKLAILTSHPIQYNAPLFKILNERGVLEIKVFYTLGESILQNKWDSGFRKNITWDIPLLDGYSYAFPDNTSSDKGLHHFKGIINPALADQLNEFNPSAILIYGWSFDSHYKIMKRFHSKVPVLFRGDSTMLDENGFLKTFLRKIFLSRVYRNVDYALYTGKNNYEYFKHAGLKEAQLMLAPHAIDNERFACSDLICLEYSKAFRKELQIDENDFVFLFAGKFEPKKNPDLLLSAFLAASFNERVHLVMVGNGELEKHLKEAYSHNKSIHFLEFQNQQKMPALYKMADAFVLPSKGPGETWGLAINEAMAAGLPVIASDRCGGAIDLIVENKNGYIFESGNQQQLKDSLLKIYHNPDLENMGRSSRQRIQNFSFLRIAEVIEKVVEMSHAKKS